MKKQKRLKNILKYCLTLLSVAIVSLSCQKDDDFSTAPQNSLEETPDVNANIKTISGKQVPKKIIDFLQTETNNTLQYTLLDNKFTPNKSHYNTQNDLDNKTLSVIISKSAVVKNDNNTKYTFELASNDKTIKHNIIVIDMDTNIVSSYISYKPELSWLANHNMKTEMRYFSGDIIFYNTNGNQNGHLKLNNGIVDANTSKGLNDPCNDDIIDTGDDATDDTIGSGGNGTGGSGPGGSGPGGSGSEGSGSGGGGVTSDPISQMCTYTAGMECSAGGHHTSPANCSSGDGWSVTFSMPCGSLRTGRNATSDCDGDFAMLFGDNEYAESIISCINATTSTDDNTTINQKMISWLQGQPNTVIDPINQYLYDNNCSVAAQSFVVDAIQILVLGGEVDFNELYIETPTPDDGYIYTGSKTHISNPLILENGDEIIIDFGTTSDNQNANQEVSPNLISALKQALQNANNNLNTDEKIESIYIMATSNGGHGPDSNHSKGTALDISRINGVKMAISGVTNQITELQIAFDNFAFIRENFGPYFKHKFYISNGTWNYNYPVPGHNDHIHVSVRQ